MNHESLSLVVDRNTKRTLDPLVTLMHHESSFFNSGHSATQSGVAVSSVCFFRGREDTTGNDFNETCSEAESDDTDESYRSPLRLQCQELLQCADQYGSRFQSTTAPEMSSSLELEGRWLGSCYSSGECLLWDLGKQKVIETIVSANARGPGLTLRRLGDNDTRFFYQTRDEAGTISLHDLNAPILSGSPNSSVEKLTFVQTLQQVATNSQTFCAAVPCHGNSNLLAMPCQHHSYVMVRDWRMPSTHHPVAYFHAVTGNREKNDEDWSINRNVTKCGMVTSLAMAETNDGSATAIACGMESGLIAIHDLAMIRKKETKSCVEAAKSCAISLSMDPILSLDMVTSSSPSTVTSQPSGPSFVAIAGMAGNEDDLAELSQCERGRIAVIKICQGLHDDKTFRARLRNRISTIFDTSSSQKTDTTDALPPSGKPGVGQCRFRSDGRIFAVGGWDKRVRIYDRSAKSPTHTPLALLRGHYESVNAIDWSFDAGVSGLLATGSSDGRVHVWRCFPSKVGLA